MTPGNKAIRTRRPPFMPVPEVGGVLYLRTASSKLPWKAKTATLMVGTGGHPGNVGLREVLKETFE